MANHRSFEVADNEKDQFPANYLLAAPTDRTNNPMFERVTTVDYFEPESDRTIKRKVRDMKQSKLFAKFMDKETKRNSFKE